MACQYDNISNDSIAGKTTLSTSDSTGSLYFLAETVAEPKTTLS